MKSPTFAVLVLGAALIMWSGSVFLSTEMSKPEEISKKLSKQAPAETPVVMPSDFKPTGDLKEIAEKIQSDPSNVSLRLDYGQKLLELGGKESRVPAIITAVNEFNEVLKLEPENSSALLALARISFETGANENSISYFDRYLKLKPEDKRARNDLALAYLQRGDSKTAIAILEELNFRHSDYFESSFALALAHLIGGDKEKASEQATEAMAMAKTPKQKEAVNSFIGSLKVVPGKPQQAKIPSSPATVVQNYFENHPIIGSKLVTISWDGPEKAIVKLKEFPIAGMPEVAMASFEAKTKAALSSIDSPLLIEIFDQAEPDKKINFELNQ